MTFQFHIDLLHSGNKLWALETNNLFDVLEKEYVIQKKNPYTETIQSRKDTLRSKAKKFVRKFMKITILPSKDVFFH